MIIARGAYNEHVLDVWSAVVVYVTLLHTRNFGSRPKKNCIMPRNTILEP